MLAVHLDCWYSTNSPAQTNAKIICVSELKTLYRFASLLLLCDRKTEAAINIKLQGWCTLFVPTDRWGN